MKGETLELEPIQSGPVAAPMPNDPEAILRFALEKNVPVETIERLMVMRTQVRAEQSKESFDLALASFQSECPVIEKRKQVMNKDGRSVRYSFAPLDDVVKQVKDLLKKHGFSYSVTAKVEQGWVEAFCKIKHSAGHFETSEFKVPIESDAYMSGPQKYAASLTFCKRYAFLNGFGILTGDEDVDGKLAKPKPQGPSTVAADGNTRELAKQLWVLLAPVRGPKADWSGANQWLTDEGLLLDGEWNDKMAPAVSAKRYMELIAAATKKLTK